VSGSASNKRLQPYKAKRGHWSGDQCRDSMSTMRSARIDAGVNQAFGAARDSARGMIRDYDAARDRQQLRECIVCLQEHERGLEPALPEGPAMADDYLAFLVDRCARLSGTLMVAEVEGRVAGFVSVFGKVPPEEPDEEQAEYAYVSDLVVLPAYRGQGLGRGLLEAAQAFARAHGARTIWIGVLSRNRAARELYQELGFMPYHLQMVKRLT
jgi:ribosomal protein S18 acetylase RimI-like enzyme